MLDAITQTAARLCQADYAISSLRDGDYHRRGQQRLMIRLTLKRTHAHNAWAGSITGRAALERKTIHMPDILADPDYGGALAPVRELARTVLGVPLREGRRRLA